MEFELHFVFLQLTMEMFRLKYNHNEIFLIPVYKGSKCVGPILYQKAFNKKLQ